MHSVRRAPLAPALLALAALTQAPRATAETPAENKAAARNLAIQGVQLAERDACDEAIPLFERAEALFHAPTILASLGECQVRLGRLVEGTETLRKVIREKLAADAPQAFVDAQARAQALFDEYQPQIAQLTIEVEPTGLRPRLLVDGSPVSGAFVGVPRPTDPGAHHVEVSAEGHETTEVEVSLDPGARETVRLTLQPRPEESPSALTESPQGSSTQRLLGYVGVGLGGALLSAGAITGAMAVGKENSLEQRCPEGRCPAGERGTLDDANTMATVATVATLGGAAFGLTGLVLLLTANDDEEVAEVPAHAEVTPWLGWGSLGVSGTF